jgi:hypothetical protein
MNPSLPTVFIFGMGGNSIMLQWMTTSLRPVEMNPIGLRISGLKRTLHSAGSHMNLILSLDGFYD